MVAGVWDVQISFAAFTKKKKRQDIQLKQSQWQKMCSVSVFIISGSISGADIEIIIIFAEMNGQIPFRGQLHAPRGKAVWSRSGLEAFYKHLRSLWVPGNVHPYMDIS